MMFRNFVTHRIKGRKAIVPRRVRRANRKLWRDLTFLESAEYFGLPKPTELRGQTLRDHLSREREQMILPWLESL